MDSSEAKAALRKQLRAARRQLDSAARRLAADAALTRLRDSRFLAGCRVVALFAPFRAEIDPTGLQGDYDVVYPRIEDGLVFVRSTHEALKPGRMGILEPVGVAIAVDEIDGFVVPGLAFTARGDRLGYGGGHYDRVLCHARGKTVGIGYDFQVLDDLPTNAHDVRLDAVVTDKRFFDTGSA